MSIANGIGITSYRGDQPKALEGSPGSFEPPLVEPVAVPQLPQRSRVAIGGTPADGNYSTTVRGPDGIEHTVTTVRATTPATNANLATQHRLDLLAAAALSNIVDDVAVTSSTNVDITFKHAGTAYEVTTSPPSGATMAVSQLQAPAGTDIPVGRFMVYGAELSDAPSSAYSPATVQLPSGTTDEADIVGITLRPLGAITRTGSTDPDTADMFEAPGMADLAFDGFVNMRNVGAAAQRRGRVYCVVSTAGGDELGQASGGNLGGDQGVAQVATLTPGAGQNSVEVSVQIRILTGDHAGESIVLSALADGSMTATEVCDAWRTQLNADAVMSALLVDSGTSTCVLTAADPSITFDVNNVQGTVTIDLATTAGATYALPLSKSRCWWDEPTAHGEIGRVYFKR